MGLLDIYSHRAGGNTNHSLQLTNADQKSLETMFLIASQQLSTHGIQKLCFYRFLIYVRR